METTSKSTRDFGTAITALKNGYKLTREGWNGKNMFIVLSEYESGTMYKDGKLLPHILMKTVQGGYVPWLASQTDVLAEDWTIIEN